MIILLLKAVGLRWRLPVRPSFRFTLVELLVVISIISVLMAMLMPSLRYAREAARRTDCLNNSKQIASAFAMYRNNYDGRFPPCGWYFAPGVNATVGQAWQDSIGPYIDWVPDIFICLSDPNPDDYEWFIWEGKSNFDSCSYAVNEDVVGTDNMGTIGGAAGGRNGRQNPSTPGYEHGNVGTSGEGRLVGDVLRIRNPSECMLTVDSDYMYVNSQTPYFRERVLQHHGNGFNASFCDSHASWVPTGDIEKVTTDPDVIE
jgi:prepilin-type N-terminal cleavage/methylation domain-containing protein/prepilin-type processing-associated H-X9-DG protein